MNKLNYSLEIPIHDAIGNTIVIDGAEFAPAMWVGLDGECIDIYDNHGEYKLTEQIDHIVFDKHTIVLRGVIGEIKSGDIIKMDITIEDGR